MGSWLGMGCKQRVAERIPVPAGHVPAARRWPLWRRWGTIGVRPRSTIRDWEVTISMADSIYDIEVQTLGGETRTLDELRGEVLLVVNTASRCGFTPQYEGLQKLHEAYSSKGLAVLGFPCNQFGKQEPGSEDEIGKFCELNYGVQFAMHAKIDVHGATAHPLFKKLTREAPGLFGIQRIKWNFTKFLVDRQGDVVGRFAPSTRPEKLEKEIESLL
jgi:glutathione peroxidase